MMEEQEIKKLYGREVKSIDEQETKALLER